MEIVVMFRIFSSSRLFKRDANKIGRRKKRFTQVHSHSPWRNRARLGVEGLESRDCPTPSITLTAAVIGINTVSLKGSVSDSSPCLDTVTFGGVVNASTKPGTDGCFSLQTTLRDYQGVVSAVAIDPQSQTSNRATVSVSVPAPTLSLSVCYGTDHQVILSGILNATSSESQSISFNGVVCGRTTTGRSGSFSSTVTASGLGKVTANYTDCWNRTATAQATVANTRPQLQNVTIVQQSGFWIISGNVVDEHPQGLTVGLTSTDIPSINGMTATVDQYGQFSFRFSSCVKGWINLDTTDWWASQSILFSDLLA